MLELYQSTSFTFFLKGLNVKILALKGIYEKTTVFKVSNNNNIKAPDIN